jgi:hypothetical protein
MVKSLNKTNEQKIGNYTIDVTDITPGLYFLKLYSTESLETLRFIKK